MRFVCVASSHLMLPYGLYGAPHGLEAFTRDVEGFSGEMKSSLPSGRPGRYLPPHVAIKIGSQV